MIVTLKPTTEMVLPYATRSILAVLVATLSLFVFASMQRRGK
jgi:hypothetical protein